MGVVLARVVEHYLVSSDQHFHINDSKAILSLN